MRAGALLFAATVVSVGSTYLFYLVAGRVLGTSDYGELAAVLSLVTLAALPFTAVQMALSREISSLVARGEPELARRLSHSLVATGAVATVVLLVIYGALVVPLTDLLNLDSVAMLGVVALAVAPAVLYPVLLGDLQGHQEWRRLAFATGFPLAFRFVAFLVLFAVGWRLYGALAAMAIGALAGLALPAWWRRHELVRAARRVPVRPFLTGLVPVMVGILAVTALTNVDVLMVKARLSSDDAGIYGAASAFAKVAFFLPTAIVGVVFPRVAARRARGEPTQDILGRALLVTVVFCALLFGIYGLVGGPLIRLTYGEDFAEAASLLGLFGIGMTFFSLANVLVGYHLSRHDARFAWALGGAACVQAVALALVPADMRTFLWVNAGVGIALFAVHELVMGSSAEAIRSGAAHAWHELAPKLRLRDRLRAARRPALEAVGVLLGFTALAVALTWPLAAGLGSKLFEGTGDSIGTIADFWRQAEITGYHVTGTTHVTTTGAPFGWEQGNGVNIQSALPYYPAYLFAEAFGPVVAYNLAALSGLVLSAAAMYWLVRRLTGSILVAAWGGLVYMLFPWHFWKAAVHASLAHLEGFPLLALALLAWYRKPDLLRAGAIALTIAILWTTSGYYGVMGLLILLVVLPIAAWFHRRRFGWRAAGGRLALAFGGGLAIGLAVYGIASLGSVNGEIAPARDVSDLAWFGARIWEFFVPAADSVAFGDLTEDWLLQRQHLSNYSETTLYVGWLTLLLALGYVAWAIVKRRQLTESARFTVVAFSALVVLAILFMPPHPISAGSVNIPTPSWLVWKLVPQFRVPTRWMPVLMLGLVVLAALALALVRARVASRVRTRAPRASAWAAAGVVVLAAGISYVELSPLPDPLSGTGIGREYAFLANTPEGILAEYPLTQAGQLRTSDYQFAQRIHRRPLVDGAPNNTYADAVSEVLIDPTAPGVAGGLATLGVTAVITRNVDHIYESGAFRVPRSLGEGYERVGSIAGGGTAVWAVTAEPEPLAFFPYGFWFSERVPGRLPYQWMSGSEGHVEVVAPRAGRYLVHFQAQSYLVPRRMVIQGVDSAWALDVPPVPTDFFVPVELPRGLSRFVVRVEPGPQLAAPPDQRLVSVYLSNWVFEPLEPGQTVSQPVRPALLSPDPVPSRPPQ